MSLSFSKSFTTCSSSSSDAIRRNSPSPSFVNMLYMNFLLRARIQLRFAHGCDLGHSSRNGNDWRSHVRTSIPATCSGYTIPSSCRARTVYLWKSARLRDYRNFGNLRCLRALVEKFSEVGTEGIAITMDLKRVANTRSRNRSDLTR